MLYRKFVGPTLCSYTAVYRLSSSSLLSLRVGPKAVSSVQGIKGQVQRTWQGESRDRRCGSRAGRHRETPTGKPAHRRPSCRRGPRGQRPLVHRSKPFRHWVRLRSCYASHPPSIPRRFRACHKGPRD